MIAPSVRDALQFCEVESDRLSLAHFPDFLVVGPQRTGTTWLHQVLSRHPEVFLADPKELFFFSRLKDRTSPRFESALLDWYLAHFTDPWPRWITRQVRSLVRMGTFYRPKVRGEATASYAAMDRDLIAEISVLNPAVKAMMMVRDPVERAWSHAKKDLVRNRGRKVEDVADEEWQAFFRDPYQLRCARYRECLANWRSFLPAGQVFVGTFEEVEETPAALLERVTRFLGVSDDPRYVDADLLRSTVNPAGGSEVPARLRSFLGELLGREVEDWKRLREEVRAGAVPALPR